jgi:hypothetical protein
VQKRHDRVIFDAFLMEVISNDQDALVLTVGPPDSLIGWSAIASKGDPLRLHPSRNPLVSLVVSIGRQE